MSSGHGNPNPSSSPLPSIPANRLVSVESNDPAGAHHIRPRSRSRPSLGRSPPTRDASAPIASAVAESDKSGSSAAGLQHLLNPVVTAEPAEKINRRRNADHFDIPPPKPYGNTPQMSSAALRTSPGAVILPSLTPPPISAYPDMAASSLRRTLTPRTPSAYMAASATFGGPKGTIDARKSPFGASRDLHSALGPDFSRRRESSVGAMGPAVVPAVAFAVVNAPTRSPPGRRASMGSVQRPPSPERRVSVGGQSQMQTSRSGSPSTTYSSYSQFSHTPPVPLPAIGGHPTSTAGYFPPSYTLTGGAGGGFAAVAESHPKESFSPRTTTSLGPNAYHLMTLNTEQGPIQVPVDVQAASKVADEKRKRNATASHRFRQRRKEKERETSQNIAKLEHQVRELAEEKDFYRLERDYFRTMVQNQAGQPSIGPRPTSPRLLRPGLPGGSAGAVAAAVAYPNPSWTATEEENRGARNTRRRTSSYVPPPGLAPPVNLSPHATGPPPMISPAPPVRHAPSAKFDPSTPAHYEDAWKPGP